ncbi:hypothetical protein K493DRAFT_315588 [Basidiobolus meristosporus CBS 931.73]|uniref:Velvet domain-containing protein n=1 Tax=Basidiobolus meristosporus CBS 931.73 TaxID=1314790 RepID=A0A1Y1Y875_9FUNG|nr:hypothetical protein K493DRAFT_315588 [Basidiobolus meristosporus CBS 931.73]|eukprot:ORX94232.1 hypothetical protein K493DRAFT_315588 [Basidiobolus meristosporus CBS 931.73]
MCGFGEKDKRSLDPPPIVKLNIFDDSGTHVEDCPQSQFYVVYVDLWSEDQLTNCTAVVDPSSLPSFSSQTPRTSVLSLSDPIHVKNLVGTTTSSAHVLQNCKGESGIYFIFPELSVRTTGTFCLRFTLIDLSNAMNDGQGKQIESVFSKTFKVYSARTFPGMNETTELSLRFFKQGVRIPTRKIRGLES